MIRIHTSFKKKKSNKAKAKHPSLPLYHNKRAYSSEFVNTSFINIHEETLSAQQINR